MDEQSIEKIEIDLFLEALYQRYGYDFRHYAPASMRRRVRHLLARTSGSTVADLIPRVLHDEAFARAAIHDQAVTVTEMFRDPDFYSAVRQAVLPYLGTLTRGDVTLTACTCSNYLTFITRTDDDP